MINATTACIAPSYIDSVTPCAYTSRVDLVIRGHNGRWVAEIKFQNNYLRLGAYDTIEEARKAREAAEKRYHGEYAARCGVLTNST